MNNIFTYKKFFQNKTKTFAFARAIFLLLFLGFSTNALAQVEITEIMYDLEGSDAKHEWVELYNNSNEPINISNWQFFEADTNHKLNLVSGGGTLVGGGYAVIVSDDTQFLSDWPEFSGNVFDSSFNLSNTGELLSIRDGELKDNDSVSYLAEWGANGDGNSLQKINNSWFGVSPTPGALNIAGNTNSNATTTDSVVSESANSATNDQQNTTNDNQEPYIAYSNTIPEWVAHPPLTAYAGARKRIGIAGTTVQFIGAARAADNINTPLSFARYLWSFGDGARGEGENIKHTYYYPGEYIVTLDVVLGNDNVTDRVLVEVINADIAITNVLFDNPSFIEIKNNSSREFDLSQWQLKVDQQVFVFPSNTFIMPNKKLVFPSQVTKLLAKKGDKINLLYPNGAIATKFNNIDVENNIQKITTASTTASTTTSKNTHLRVLHLGVSPPSGGLSQKTVNIPPVPVNATNDVHLGVKPPSEPPSEPPSDEPPSELLSGQIHKESLSNFASSTSVANSTYNNQLFSSSSAPPAIVHDSAVLGYKNTATNIEGEQLYTSNFAQAQSMVSLNNNLGKTNQQQNTKKDTGLFWGLLGVSFLSLIAIYVVLVSSNTGSKNSHKSSIQNEANTYKIIEIEE